MHTINKVFAVETIMEEVRRQYQNLKLGFITTDYWETLWATYVRTVSDITGLAGSRFSGVEKIRILEIGAFCGVVATALKRVSDRFEITAWDLPLFMEDKVLMAHYQQTGIHCAAGNLSQLPLEFSAETFDIVICCEVIEHLNFNPLPIFCEFNRLLKVDGILYLGTPNQANIVKRLLLARGRSIHNPVQHLVWQLNPKATFSVGLHWREFTAAELVQIIELTTFQVIRSYYCHNNECQNPNVLRRVLVRLMYAYFPSCLPTQVVIARKKSICDIQNLATK